MKILTLDCNNLLYRTFWVSKNNIEDTDSGPIIVHLFLNSLFSYVKQFKPDRIYAVWDKKLNTEAKNFRKELLVGQYKSGRDKSLIDGAHDYDDNIKDLLENLGIQTLYPYNLEADDVIGWLTTTSKVKDHQHIIVTVDKDMLQLVDVNTSVYSPIKKVLYTKETFQIHNKNIEQKYFLPMKALIGDQSDNISGLHKVGEKKGYKLAIEIVDKGNIGCLTEEQREIYYRNLQIMDLRKGFFYEHEYVHYEKQLDNHVDKRNYNGFITNCTNLGLNRIINNKQQWYNVFFEANKLSRLVEQLGLH